MADQSKSELPELTNFANNWLNPWLQAIEKNDFANAQKIAEVAVLELKSLLTCSESESSDNQKNTILVLAIVIRGLYDFSKLKSLTANADWHTNNRVIETVWGYLWDCRERIEFGRFCVSGTLINIIQSELNEIELFYKKMFGPGKYSSPEILIKRAICSICQKELRKCEHRPGVIYSGKICCCIPEDSKIKSISTVETPKDPRCRIWPWNCNGNRVKSAIMTTFRVDDFMENDNWVEKN
ncbi:MAG: hypothetical protein ABSF37_05280 [Sedimentisphaerales bacterium]